MKRTIITLAILLLCRLALAQGISVETAKFRVGDNPAWASPSFNDTSWDVLRLDTDWNAQGIDNDNAYGWYRLHVVIPSSLKGRDSDKILLALGTIDDADETFLNGVLVGKTDGYDSPRRYIVDRKLVRWDKENVIAVRVYNGDPPGLLWQTRMDYVGFGSLYPYTASPGYTALQRPGGLWRQTWFAGYFQAGILRRKAHAICC